MVSFWDLRTFEMILTVSLIRLSSRLKPKENLVENLTITRVSVITMQKNHWISLRTITSGSTHPVLLKKVEHSPVQEKCSM